jgi:hypothetical protein
MFLLRGFTTRSYSIEDNGLGCAFPFPSGLYQLTCTSFRIFLPKLSNLHPMLISASRNLQTVQSGELIFSSYVSYPLTPFLINPASLNLQSATLVACSVLMSSAIVNIPPYSRRLSSWRTKWPLPGLVYVSSLILHRYND